MNTTAATQRATAAAPSRQKGIERAKCAFVCVCEQVSVAHNEPAPECGAAARAGRPICPRGRHRHWHLGEGASRRRHAGGRQTGCHQGAALRARAAGLHSGGVSGAARFLVSSESARFPWRVPAAVRRWPSGRDLVCAGGELWRSGQRDRERKGSFWPAM